MRALERKLLRDLGRLKGQVLTVALVVASGIAAFAGLRSTYASLRDSTAAYYARYRFGTAFAQLTRAPDALAARLAAIPGVASAYVRVRDYARVPLEHEPQPPFAVLTSLPDAGEAPLNHLRLERGRLPVPGHDDEAVLLAGFAAKRGILPGDTLPVIVRGVRRTLRITGLANAPEFIYPVLPGFFSLDEARAAVVWMPRRALAPLLDMEGAFNDVALRLSPGASEPAVLAAVDRLLEPYGGLGATGRDRHPSHATLDGELDQLASLATTIPVIFLAVSAFLLNVVLSRLVELQRGQIATLKAVGYTDREIGLHYLALVSVIVLLGAAIGVAAGAWMGTALTGVYGGVFHLPELHYRMQAGTVLASFAASAVAAVTGAGFAARRVMRLPPAEAMRPAAPAVYRPLLAERLGLARLVPPAWRMILRELERHPGRAVFSVLGVAVATGSLVVGHFAQDSIGYLLDLQFGTAVREDLTVAFEQPVPDRARRELLHLPGVERVEGTRTLPVRVSAGTRWRDAALVGTADDAELHRVVDWRGRPHPPAGGGVVLTTKFAELLGVAPGDSVDVRLMEGERTRFRLPVDGLVDEMFGLQAHVRLPVLDALLGEPPAITAAHLRVAPGREPDVRRRLALLPRVANVTSTAAERRHIEEQTGASHTITTLVTTLFALTMAVGVVYNNARIALSLRSRELASLRVLGFTRAEISQVLLGELGLQVLVAVPFGLLVGRWMTLLITGPIDAERIRFPTIIADTTYALAAVVVLVAGTLSALLVRHRLDHLDLVGVLKTRE